MQTLVIDPWQTRSRCFDPDVGIHACRLERVCAWLGQQAAATACVQRAAASELFALARMRGRKGDIQLALLCRMGEMGAARALLASVEALAVDDGAEQGGRVRFAAPLERVVASCWRLADGPTRASRLRLAAELRSETLMSIHVDAECLELVLVRGGASVREHALSMDFDPRRSLDSVAEALNQDEALADADCLLLSGGLGSALRSRLVSPHPPVILPRDYPHAALIGAATFLEWRRDVHG